MTVHTKYILSFDPGMSSGVSLGKYSDTEPYSLVKAWQIENGPRGLIDWLYQYWQPAYWPDDYCDDTELRPGSFRFGGFIKEWKPQMLVVSEKFSPIQNKGFNLTLGAVTPLVCEGVLLALGVMPDYPDKTWQRPNAMYLFGGKTLPEKKKLARKFLKDTNNYVMPKVLGTKDSNDAVSATLHGVSYLAKVHKHRPTFEMISAWGETDVIDLTKSNEQG